MAEVGLVGFARLALEVSQAVLPAQRTKFSKRQFTQPQLLAVLCLMRYEDWTFREAEVRLSEHSELRSALGLNSVPDYTTLYRFLARLDPADVARVMNEIRRRMPGSDRSPATVAIDATGLAQAAVSRYFIRRIGHFGQPQLEALVEMAHHGGCGPATHPRPAGAASAVERLRHTAHAGGRSTSTDTDRLRAGRRRIRLGPQPYLLPRTTSGSKHHPGQTPLQLQGIRCASSNARELPRRAIWKGSLIESVYSAVKRKLSARAPGRTLHTQSRQALLLGLAFNLYRLWLPAL